MNNNTCHPIHKPRVPKPVIVSHRCITPLSIRPATYMNDITSWITIRDGLRHINETTSHPRLPANDR